MHAETPPPSLAFSTPPSLTCAQPPPSITRGLTSTPAAPPSVTQEASPHDVLWQLLREWYGGVAELLIGEVAAADVMGYADTAYFDACERTGLLSSESQAEEDGVGGDHPIHAEARGPASSASFAGDGETESLVHALHRGISGYHDSPTEKLMANLVHLLPVLRSSASPSPLSSGVPLESGKPHQDSPQHTSAVMPLFCQHLQQPSSSTDGPPSPSRSMPTVLPHPSPVLSSSAAAAMSWMDVVADTLNAAMDALDVGMDTVFGTHHRAISVTHSSSPSRQTTAQPTTQYPGEEDDLEGSCIVAGLLLCRHVRVRRGPAYATVVSPLLVVLDLDLTILRQPLSTIVFRATQSMSLQALRALFVDADFFKGFCEAVSRHGHTLAICSLTEGAADQHGCGLSVSEVVVALLSAILPPTRRYLTHPEDVVCLPKSSAGPGKLYHLQVLQERRNAQDAAAATTRDGASAYASAGLTGKGDVASWAVSEDGVTIPSALLQLPRWLSTDVVLVDDDRENCRSAVMQGYHAVHCAGTGMTAGWFAVRPELQVLLGVTPDEIYQRRSDTS